MAYVICLQSLDCWIVGSNPAQGVNILSIVLVVFCVGRGCVCVCVCVCDVETSTMRRPRPSGALASPQKINAQ